MDRHLGHPLFREVSPLRAFPMANQTLLKQAGYRDLLRTFRRWVKLGSRLALDLDVNDIFAASQRNAAALYEYWTFLQLADAVGGGMRHTEECRGPRSPPQDGLSIGFRQGSREWVEMAHRASQAASSTSPYFSIVRFKVSASYELEASWTRAMRPDCSLHIQPRSRTPTLADPGDLDVWLHFDAKYRVEHPREQFDASEGARRGRGRPRLNPLSASCTRSRREDLLKMHAYRDAIRRTAGAYVLFPGQRESRAISRISGTPSGSRGLRTSAGTLANRIRPGGDREVPVGRYRPCGRSGNTA